MAPPTAIGVLFAQQVERRLEVAVLFNPKSGKPLLPVIGYAGNEPRPLMHRAVAQHWNIKGFDVGTVVPFLTIASSSRNRDQQASRAEYSVSLNRRDDITLPDTGRWVPIDEFEGQKWSAQHRPFVKEAVAVLHCFEDHYACEAPETLMLSEIARKMVIDAKRSDLLFGVTVRTLREPFDAHGGGHAWYSRLRIDWLLAPGHPRATPIGMAVEIAVIRRALIDMLSMPVADFALWFDTMAPMVNRAAVLHIELFGSVPSDFNAEMWCGIANKMRWEAFPSYVEPAAAEPAEPAAATEPAATVP
jgi:hypothetical protein